MTHRYAVLSLTVGIFVASLFGACSLIPSLIPCVERRHESGLLLVCREQFKDMPEELKGAASWGWVLAEDHPYDLGYPWPNPDTKELEFRVLGPRGEAAVREWMAGNATKLGPKPMDLPRPQVPIKFIAVDRSFRQLQDIQQGVVPPKGLPDGDAIYATGPDTRRNATVITMDRLSDALLRALAARYGIAAIVIRVDPSRPRTVPQRSESASLISRAPGRVSSSERSAGSLPLPAGGWSSTTRRDRPPMSRPAGFTSRSVSGTRLMSCVPIPNSSRPSTQSRFSG